MRKAAAVITMLFIVGSAFGSGNADEELPGLGGLTGIHSVSIKAHFLDVELMGSDTQRVEVSLGTQDNHFGPSHDFRIRHADYGDRLDVWVETDWPFGRSDGATLRVRLPRGVQVRVETVTGPIRAHGLAGVSCDLRTVSGEIELQDVSGGIKARTVSGAILGDAVDFRSDSTFSSVSGRVEIQSIPSLDGLRFDLSSISGRIVVGNIRASRGLRMGFFGPLVRAQTVSGSLLFR